MAAGVPAGQAGSKSGPLHPAESVCMDTSPTVHSQGHLLPGCRI